MTHSSCAPLMVLSGHRSGSSAFVGLLAAAGLHLGELLPPAPDNPRGFFENRFVVELNRKILYDRDRDWTCPPPKIDHHDIDLEPLTRVVETLRRESKGRPWGFKDPRTLFTLPAWAAAIGNCRLVGVHRNSRDVARSLAARGNLSVDEATAVAKAYSQRLAEAHRRLDFPIVSFDADRDAFLARTAAIADELGLDWDATAAESLYEDRMVHHRDSRAQIDEFDAYLAKAAEAPIRSIREFSASTLVRTWDSIESDLAEALPLDRGPRYQDRRSELLRAASDRLTDTSSITFVERIAGPRPRGSATFSSTPEQLLHSSADGTRARSSHIVAPSLLDHVPPESISTVLDAVAGLLEQPGLAAIGGWVLDTEKMRSAHVFMPALVRASRDHEPYLHHIDELAAALLEHRLWISSVERTPGGRTHLLLTNDPTFGDVHATPHGTRKRLAALERRERELEEELAKLRAETSETAHALRKATEELQRMSTQLTSSEEEAAALRESLNSAQVVAKRARERYDRLANRRIVRVALRVAATARPIFRWVRKGPRPAIEPIRGKPDARSAPIRTRQEIVEAIRRRPHRSPSTAPLVSIVLLTRDGAEHLSRLLPALSDTSYPEFELIVVDNGSTDETAEILYQPWPFPVRVIKNDHNQSFSEGNNRGAATANGEILLFLNNDVEPIAPGWLQSMVATLQQPETVAVGAVLVYPERGDPRTDFRVQHMGIRLTLRDGAPYAENIGLDDPLDDRLRGVWDVDAATGAVLMVQRSAFDRVGGFDEGYVYGAEDVDLCIRLGQLGRVVVDGDAMLFHYESASQDQLRRELVRINRTGNWRRFAEKWGPTLTRTLAHRRLNPSIGGTTNTVMITLTRDDSGAGWGDYYTAHELGDAFEAEGWKVIYAERYRDHWYETADADLVISLLDAYDVRKAPAGAYTIAWVRNWVDRWIERPWFESFDLVVASSGAAAAEISKRTPFRPPVIPLATNPRRFSPGPLVPTFEADVAFTGNNWGQGREIVGMLTTRFDERVLFFGKGWESEPRVARYWRGHLPYELLPDLYRSVKIVLDDTAGPTRTHGFLNGRVFDALASGALVITDNVDASKDLFDGELPTYSSKAELREQLDRYLGDEELRARTVAALRSRVLENYTYDRLPARFCAAATREADQPKVAIKIGVPDESEMEAWGDTHFARALSHALVDAGYTGEVHILPEWDRPERQDADVVIHLRGLTAYTPKPAHVNVMWLISHPEDLVPGECDRYDLILVASRTFADRLAKSTDTPVVYLPQACREVTVPLPDPGLATEVLFVGNSRGQRRPSVEWAIEAGLPLAVYGGGWRGLIPDHYIRADYFPNEQLPQLYASAKVVLNDHWPDMRRHGFVSNRIFDVLSAGGVVVSDSVDGMDELFGDLVPTYSNRDEFESLVRALLDDDERRKSIRIEGPELIRGAHTFQKRAMELSALIEPLLKGRPKDIDGNTF